MSALRDPALATLAHRNMVEAFALLPLHQPNGVVRRDGSVLVAATRSPIPIFNEVLAIEDDVDAASLAGAVQAMRDIGAPWVAHFRGDVGDHAASVALELGLEEEETFYPAMVLTDLPRRSDPRSDLEVVRFEGSQQYDSYVALSASISGADESVLRTWFGSGLLDDPNVVALVGYVDGTPVAKAMSIRTGEVVGIYDVGTLETARRRGYGWAMTLAAIVAGASSGATVATLQSSEMGFPLYSSHGFETVFDYRRFLEPDSLRKQA